MNDQTAPASLSTDEASAKIEGKIDKGVHQALEVSRNVGGVVFSTALEAMEFSKLLSISGKAIPKHLRNNPGGCLAIVFQAIEWRMSPFAVANKSYEVNDRVAYESQLIHAVIESRAPLKTRLRAAYEGEGVDRCCIVSGTFIGESEPQQYRSPTIKEIKVKNSPLWTADPDQQLWYYSSRAWCRKFAPDVLLGIYSKDELEDSPIGDASDRARDISPIAAKLAASGPPSGDGFNHAGINAELENVGVKTGEVIPPEPKKKRGGKSKPGATTHASEDAARASEPAEPTQDLRVPPATPSEEITEWPANAKPTNAGEYEAYCLSSIRQWDGSAPMLREWFASDDEGTLRAICKVPIDLRKKLGAEVDAKAKTIK